MVSSFAFMFRYSSLAYQPEVVFSSGSFIVYFVIPSKMGIDRNGKDPHACVLLPRFGGVFQNCKLICLKCSSQELI